MSSTNQEAEISVLSALIKYPDLMDGCGITTQMFSDDHRAEIFSMVAALSGVTAFDALTLSDALGKRTGENWLPIVGVIASQFSNRDLFSGYAKIVKRDYLRRETASIAERLLNRLDDETAVDSAISELMALEISDRKYEFSMREMMVSAVDQTDRAHECRGRIPGVSSGLIDLDTAIGGFHPGDLIIVGARPAMGKTAMMLNFSLASSGGAGIISTEQDHRQAGQRFIGIDGAVSLARMRSGKLKEEDFIKISDSASRIKDHNIWLNEKRKMTVPEIARQTRKWVKRYQIKILFVDYIQRLHATNATQSKAYQIGDIAKGLKDIAGELEIPVVALAQVKREVDTRPDKRPYMSDMKDSGEIEQEADLIMTIYRDDVYNPESPDKGIAELIIGKNRHGPTGSIKTVWDAPTLRFMDIDKQYANNIAR